MPAAPVRLHQLLPFLTCSVCRRQRCQPRDPAAAGRCADDTSGLPAPGESCHPEQRAKSKRRHTWTSTWICIIYPQQSPTQDLFVSAMSKVKCSLEHKGLRRNVKTDKVNLVHQHDHRTLLSNGTAEV